MIFARKGTKMKQYVFSFIARKNGEISVLIDAENQERARELFCNKFPGVFYSLRELDDCSTEPDKNGPVSYRDNIVELIDRQREKGLKKYGQTLEQNTTLSTVQRIEHAQEELVDALQYLEHLKQAQTDHMTVNDFQRSAMRTLGGMDYSNAGENGLLQNSVMGLNGEAGEVIDIVKKHLFQDHDLDREHLREELGDVLAYVAGCCEALGLTMEDVAAGCIDKLKKRYPEGFDKARSINREKEAEK